jgi:DNA polymerase V
MTKVFALVDCNSFYCSCERLFRPDLRNKPVGVLSNNDGCFVSRTKELKDLGVAMGEPYFKVKEICDKKNVAVFSANFSLYTNMSDRVMETLAKFTPEMEIYSVDEAFLDLSDFHHFDLIDYCREIKRVVERNTGIPVSIGIGPSKTLAKVANHIGKNDVSAKGVVSLMEPSARDIALAKIPVGKVWGIGKQKAMNLRLMNIKTAKQLRDYKNDALIQKQFTKVTRMTQDELRGLTCFDLSLEVDKKKEIISSRTFGQPVYDLKSLRESVANYVSLASEKLRKQDSVCSSVEVWIRTNPHKEIPQYYAVDSHKFEGQTADTKTIIKYAWQVLDKLYRHGYEYKKALVKLSGIRDKNQTQLSLFGRNDSKKSEALMKTMDLINARDGHHTIRSGGCGVDNKAWKMKQNLKSPRFVTGWTELPKV